MYLTETVESDDDLEPQRNHENECIEHYLEIESAPIESVAFEEQAGFTSECPTLPVSNDLNQDNNI